MKRKISGWTLAFIPLISGASIGTAQAQEYLVGLRVRPDASLRTEMTAGGQVLGYSASLNAFRVRLSGVRSLRQSLDELRRNPQIAYVEPNVRMEALKKSNPSGAIVANDPFYSQQYALGKMQVSQAWNLWSPISQTVVAILDTGVDAGHPDLTNAIYRDANRNVIGYNFTVGNSDTTDGNGHGTFCAGEIAAQANNGIGVAGVAGPNSFMASGTENPIKIMPIKVLAADGSGYLSWVCDGITWAVDHGAKVISLSLGAPSSSQTLDTAVSYANARGCLVVAAAGNNGVSTKFYPAATPGVLSVGATNSGDRLTSFSNYGDWVKIAAPGEGILSTLPSNQYGNGSGTSMACPLVAAAAAVLRAQFPQMSNGDLSNLLTTQTDPYTPYESRLIAPNGGRLNLYKALSAAGGTPPAPSPPVSTVTLQGMSLQWSEVPGGIALGGRVELSGQAPGGGIVIRLESSNLATATLPSATVTVRAGERSAYFAIQTLKVVDTSTSIISARFGEVTKSATLKVTATKIIAFVIDPRVVVGGKTSRLMITLSAPAPTGGTTVTFRANSDYVILPASAVIPAGSRSVRIEFPTRVVNTIQNVQISATLNGASKTADLTIKTNK